MSAHVSCRLPQQSQLCISKLLLLVVAVLPLNVDALASVTRAHVQVPPTANKMRGEGPVITAKSQETSPKDAGEVKKTMHRAYTIDVSREKILRLPSVEHWISNWLRIPDIDLDDIFQSPEKKAFFSSTRPSEWGIMFCLLLTCLVIDNYLLSYLKSIQGHLFAVGFWLAVSVAYGVHLYVSLGKDHGQQYTLGYLLEIILSIDNVFVFCMLFETFRPPASSQHKAMFLGVIGAVISRMVLFWFLNKILTAISWIRPIFGFLLIVSGLKAASDDDDEDGPIEDGVIIRCLRACLGSRFTSTWDNGNILSQNAEGRLCFTLLLPLVICVELTDIVFATDSLTAKVAQIPNQHACFSSSAFAICALRAMFFVLQDMVDYFQHLKYGLCVILVFIGVELVLSDYVALPASALIIVISVVFSCTLISSLRAKQLQDREKAAESEEPAGSKIEAGGTLGGFASDLDDAAHEGEVQKPQGSNNSSQQHA